MIYGSACSGIEAATVAWTPLGWRAAWFAEIDPFPNAVLAHHYPSVPNLGDFTKIGAEHGPIDLLVGGTPCEDFSIAGLRKGLAGESGNLAIEFLRLVDRLRPRWLVWENVPGVISSGDNALAVFLDGLEEIGYITDMDILDAQFFGLAQRRRRVFVCAQRVDDLLKAKTISSALTIAQCLAETLVLGLAVLRNLSATDLQDLAFDGSQPAHSLQRRMRLFGLQKDEAAQMLRESLAVFRQWSEPGQNGSDLDTGRNGAGATKSIGVTRSTALNGVEGNWRAECLSAEVSWSNCLADLSQIVNESTTSTCENATTEKIIYSFARTLLHIAALITPSMDSSPSFWSAASSISTAIEVYINYARQTSSSLFTPVEWLQPWHYFLGQAERAIESYDDIRIGSFGSLFSLSSSLSGNPAPGREKGHRIADTIVARPAGDRGDGMRKLVYQCYGTNVGKLGTIRAGNGGVTGGVPFVVTNDKEPKFARDLCPTLTAGDGGAAQRIVAFDWQAGSGQGKAVVRRLTPREVEQLQGFPDDWTLAPFGRRSMSDSRRYSCLGKSMAVPVVRWIGERIERTDG